MDLAALRKQLGDENPDNRRAAVQRLFEESGDDLPELVLIGLGDADWRVRKEAVEVAAAVAARTALMPALISAIAQGDNVGLRNAAVQVVTALGPSAAPELIAALETCTDHGRKFLVEALGEAGGDAAAAALVATADDEDANVAAAVIDALAVVGGPQAERALLQKLGHPDPFQRMAALDGLMRMGVHVGWEHLAGLLSDKLVRRVALGLLGGCGDARAVVPLLDALREPSLHMVRLAATALAQLVEESIEARGVLLREGERVDDGARNSLRTDLRDEQLANRQASAVILASLRDEASLPGIVDLASEDALPPAAIAAIEAWGTALISPLLRVAGLAVGVRRGTALALAADLAHERIAAGDPVDAAHELRTALRSALADDLPSNVIAAIRALALWGEGEDAAVLVTTAGRAEAPSVSRACAVALEVVADRHPEAVRSALCEAQLDSAGGFALLRVMGALGVPDVFERLQTALSADHAETRRAAVEGLANLGDSRAAELIGLALADESVNVQIAAASALGRVGAGDDRSPGCDALLSVLQSGSPAVQSAAARALAEAKDFRAIEPLRTLLRSVVPGVAVAALEALRVLHDDASSDYLIEALSHPDGEVVKEALRGIQIAAEPRRVARLTVALEHPAWDVRQLAVRLLAECDEPAARDALRERRVHESDDFVRQSIDAALDSEVEP